MTKYDYAVWIMVGVCVFNGFILLFRKYNLQMPKMRRMLSFLLFSTACLYTVAGLVYVSQPAKVEIGALCFLGLIFSGVMWTVLIFAVLDTLLGPQNLHWSDAEKIYREKGRMLYW